jgi:hypothetical protein
MRRLRDPGIKHGGDIFERADGLVIDDEGVVIPGKIVFDSDAPDQRRQQGDDSAADSRAWRVEKGALHVAFQY